MLSMHRTKMLNLWAREDLTKKEYNELFIPLFEMLKYISYPNLYYTALKVGHQKKKFKEVMIELDTEISFYVKERKRDLAFAHATIRKQFNLPDEVSNG